MSPRQAPLRFLISTCAVSLLGLRVKSYVLLVDSWICHICGGNRNIMGLWEQGSFLSEGLPSPHGLSEWCRLVFGARLSLRKCAVCFPSMPSCRRGGGGGVVWRVLLPLGKRPGSGLPDCAQCTSASKALSGPGGDPLLCKSYRAPPEGPKKWWGLGGGSHLPP